MHGNKIEIINITLYIIVIIHHTSFIVTLLYFKFQEIKFSYLLKELKYFFKIWLSLIFLLLLPITLLTPL